MDAPAWNSAARRSQSLRPVQPVQSGQREQSPVISTEETASEKRARLERLSPGAALLAGCEKNLFSPSLSRQSLVPPARGLVGGPRALHRQRTRGVTPLRS